MYRLRTMRYAAAASCVIPAVGVLLWRDAIWPDALFLLWTAGAAAFWISEVKKADARRHGRAIEAVQQSALRTLNHHRHDWMNDLQILYGYIRMNKPDKTIESVEKIRERMAQESRLSKLGVTPLILFLQSFRTVTNTMQLEVFVEEDVNFLELPLDAEAASQALMDIITACRLAVSPTPGEPARLTVELSRTDRALQAELLYTGEWNDAEELRRKLTDRLNGKPFRLKDAEPGLRRMLLTAELRD